MSSQNNLLSTSNKKQKQTSKDLGLNPIFTMKITSGKKLRKKIEQMLRFLKTTANMCFKKIAKLK